MKRYRISTTISAKHWELLKKYTAEFETQQKVLEFALERLENDSIHSVASQCQWNPEEELWMHLGRGIKSACIIHKDCLKLLIETADLERITAYVIHQKPPESVIEFHYQKPLKKCSLKEIMDGIIINARMGNWFDAVYYTDDGDHYTLRISHSLSLKNSELNKLYIESLFKTYGIKTESEISDGSIFMHIYKNL